ncbi:hypothetical protein [Nonomuraea sediminis]|uniref:hypothetical protein n=1 Tax=Nonomuraea sediminis TaxID=2835864 RepID=UPI001BDD2413|nr:hypothetical protein [Nonomuraea sediminis]
MVVALENLPPHMRKLAEVAEIVAAAGATADWLHHLQRGTCLLRVIKDGRISPMIYIPANPDRAPTLYAEALEELRAAIKEMETGR